MPIYEYQCRECGNRLEAFQKMSDPPLTTCESCGGELRKLISAPAVQFKGSGWYVTDYAKSGAKSGATSDKSDKSDSGADKGDGGSDSAAAKSESKSDSKSSDSGGSGDSKPSAKPTKAASGSSD